jgi:hypothetical protein
VPVVQDTEPAVPVAPQTTDPNASPAQDGEITFEKLAQLKGFKSPDEMAKAYTESEKQKTRVEMGLSELLRIRGESSVPTEQEINPDSIRTSEDAVRVLDRVVQRHTQPLKDQLALQELFYQFPDAKKYATQMADVVKTNPGVSWEVAYKAAKFNDVAKEATAQGRTEAFKTLQQKQVMVAQPAQPSQRDVRPIDDLIKDRSIPFAEVQRIMRERFSQ